MSAENLTPENGTDYASVVVGMGASAGGLEAFSEFFRKMPADSGLAFVLVQHLDPNHESIMPELLAKETKMAVRQVQDETPVEPNHVYVIPPNASMRIEDGVLRLAKPTEPRGKRMAIDTFFISLAEDCGQRAACIVLSGTGSDGTLGLRAIKEHNGLTMAQSADSARYDSMPRSAIGTRLVDHVLPVTEMPSRLLDYARHLRDHPGVSSETADDQKEDHAHHLRRICQTLHRRTGHDFSNYKKGTVLRRIQRRMRVVQVDSIGEYARRLSAEPAEAEGLFADMLISVTQFFREPAAFQLLESEVFPRIFEQRSPEMGVRVWIPGCATGEEAYSLAILICEQLSKTDVSPRIQIFASDIDEHALELARTGRYSEGIAEHITPERLKQSFTFDGNTYLVNKQLREMCLFSLHNVIKDPPFSSLDLISCRNLLIYLESDLQKKLIRLFHYALRPGGYLLLGPSENIGAALELFRPVDQKNRIYQAKPTAVRMPVTFPLTRFGGDDMPEQVQDTTLHHTREQNTIRTLERVILETFAPASVVIDETGAIAYFIGRCGKYLEPGVGAPSNNLAEMARQGLRLPLRTAIFMAVKNREEIVHDRLAIETENGPRLVRLTVRPLYELGTEHSLFIVIFQELPKDNDKHPTDETKFGLDDLLSRQLETELRQTREHLQATIEELETSNEELGQVLK